MFLTQSTLVGSSTTNKPSTSFNLSLNTSALPSHSINVPDSVKPLYVCQWEVYSCCKESIPMLATQALSYRKNPVKCEKTFTTPTALFKHLLRDHTSSIAHERCHQCHWYKCTKVFRNDSNYLRRSHFKSHVLAANEKEVEEETMPFLIQPPLVHSPSLSPASSLSLSSFEGFPTSPLASPESSSTTTPFLTDLDYAAFEDKSTMAPDLELQPPQTSSSKLPFSSSTTTLSSTPISSSSTAPLNSSPSLAPSSQSLQKEIADSLLDLSEMMKSIQTSLIALPSISSSPHSARAVLDRLDSLQDSMNRFHLEWRAHRACSQKQIEELELSIRSLQLSSLSSSSSTQSS